MMNAAPWWRKTWTENGLPGLSEVKSSLVGVGGGGRTPVWRTSDVNRAKTGNSFTSF